VTKRGKILPHNQNSIQIQTNYFGATGTEKTLF
jgi:hypothetical protein